MKKLLALVLAGLLTVLVACQSRTGGGSSSSASQSDVLPSAASPPAPSVSAPPSSSQGSETAAITDPALMAEARGILDELLARAKTADEIYRAALKRDGAMEPVLMENREYLPVTDERFYTVQDIQNYLDQTFTRGGEASKRFEALQDDAVYISVNSELYMNREQRQTPLTMGSWDPETMELLLMDDKQIEVRMECMLLGRPDGLKTLRIIKNGDYWLLGDSYFID